MPYHDLMLAFAARFGNAEAYEVLVGRLATLDSELATITVSLLGHYRSRALGVRAAELVAMRNMDAAGVTAMANSAVTGTTYIYEMDALRGGPLKYCPPHPSIDIWAEMVEAWSDRNDLSLIQRWRVLTASVDLGSGRALDRLETAVLSVSDPDSPEYDEDAYGYSLRSAIDELRRRRRLLPLRAVERFARARRPNVPFAGIAAIAAHADRPALDLLVGLHEQIDDLHLKGQVLEALEILAGRLGVIVRRRKGRFVVVSD